MNDSQKSHNRKIPRTKTHDALQEKILTEDKSTFNKKEKVFPENRTGVFNQESCISEILGLQDSYQSRFKARINKAQSIHQWNYFTAADYIDKYQGGVLGHSKQQAPDHSE